METFFPLELWTLIKRFCFSKQTCLLCVRNSQENDFKNTSSFSFKRKNNQPVINFGEHLCKCTVSSTGSFSFFYVCNTHYALNTSMKITLGRKSLFFKVHDTYGLSVFTRNLRQRIRLIKNNDMMRLLCSKRDKKKVADEILRLCNTVV